jgi:hypothetical protein
MSGERLKRLGEDMVQVAVIVLLLGGLMASALYRLDALGVSGAWGVVLAAALTLAFFTVFSRSPVLPTLLVVGFSFGPTVVERLSDAGFVRWLPIFLGLGVLGLLIYAYARNPEFFKGKPGWWVPPAIFAAMFLALGLLGLTGVIGRVPGLMEAIVFGCLAALCLFAGIWNVAEASKGREWADLGSGIVSIVIGVGLIVLAILLVYLERHPRVRA